MNGMPYYKEKNFQFRLKDDQVTEQFQLWPGRAYQNAQILDENQQPIKFPITAGNLTGADGTARNVKTIQYLKNADFERLYSLFGRRTVFIRAIYVGNDEYLYSFTNSAHGKLVELLGNLQKGVFNTEYALFQQDFNASEPNPANKYKISLVKEGGDFTPKPDVLDGPTITPQLAGQQTATAVVTTPTPQPMPDSQTTATTGTSIGEPAIVGTNPPEAPLNAVQGNVAQPIQPQPQVGNVPNSPISVNLGSIQPQAVPQPQFRLNSHEALIIEELKRQLLAQKNIEWGKLTYAEISGLLSGNGVAGPRAEEIAKNLAITK